MTSHFILNSVLAVSPKSIAMPITDGICSGVAQRYLPTSEDLIGCGLAAAVRGHLSHSAPGPVWRGAKGMDR